MERSPRAIFLDACREGRLEYTVDAYGAPVFPPRDGLEWRTSAGRGAVHATTTARPRDGAPYDISLIALDEGFRMMSRVEGVDPEDVAVGMRVRVAFVSGDDGDPVPVFRPAAE